MPTAMTFSNLRGDLQAYLERGTIIDTTVYEQLPRLINNAEREISKALKIQGFINNVVGTLEIGTSVYAKPNRWRETISMYFGTGEDGNNRVEIFPRSYEYCRTYWPNSALKDVPEFYADYNYSFWLVVPTPVAAYPWEINFYQLLPLLDDTTQTNWLTDYAPTTLLYRTLMECAPFLKNDERIATWTEFYTNSLASLNTEDLQKIVDRSSSRQEA